MPAEKSAGPGNKGDRQAQDLRMRGLRSIAKCGPCALLPRSDCLQKRAQRQKWESVPVFGIGEIKNTRKAGARAVIFVPGTVRPLCPDQVFNSVVQAFAAQIATCQQRQNRPGGLRRSAGVGYKTFLVIAGAAFAPAAIAILI